MSHITGVRHAGQVGGGVSAQRIVDEGLPWPQRLEHAEECPTTSASTSDYEAWRRAVDPDDAGLFDRRLAWDELTPDSARALLGSRIGDDPTPAWLSVLHEVQQAARSGQSTDPALADVPFAPLWAPIIAHMWRRLESDVEPAAWQAVSGNAAGALRRDLGRRFAEVASHACYADFTRKRPPGRDVLLRLGTNGSAGTENFDRWCQQHLADGLQHLLDTFPVLGRLLAETALAWRRATGGLLGRIHTHREDLLRVFGATGPLTAIAPGHSDAHRGGHTVALLQFGGVTVVYKPKDLRLERGFHSLSAEINTWFGDALLHAVEVVTGAGYGFTSFVEQRTCPAAQLPTFYRAAGRLTGLLYLLGATDAHYENVIAAGPAVALIDAETLLRPRLVGDELDGPMIDSVLTTGMLPNWVLTGPDQTASDPSALGMLPAARTGSGWHHLNTDDMVWTRVDMPPVAAPSSPLGPGAANPVGDHVDALVTGLRELLLACRDERFRAILLRAVGGWRGLPQRVVLRATRIYGLTLANATSPESLRSANTRARHLERLTRSSLLRGQREPHWLVYRAELQDLENGDVPFFEHTLGSNVVRGVAGPIAGLLVGDAIQEAAARITEIEGDDLRWQEGLVRGCVLAHTLTTDRAQPAHRALTGPPAAAAAVTAELLQAIDEGVTPGVQDPAWLTLSRLPDGRHLRLGLVGDGWYDGRLGIAAALQYGGRSALAAATSAPVLRTLEQPLPYVRWRYLRNLGLGYNGVGGILRWLRRDTGEQARNAGQRRLLVDLIETLPRQLVDADRVHDLIGGVAGLLGPLAQVLGDDPQVAGWDLLEHATAHLLTAQETAGGWRGLLSVRPLTGLAHGAAGCGLALLEAGTVLQRPDVIDAGAQAFAYEASVYDRLRADWPDFRDGSGAVMTAWCHGAPGIGLTRIRALQLVPAHPDAARWREDLTAAMAATATDPIPRHDHLCCGLSGRAAVLRIAGRAMGEARWLAASDTLTDQMLMRYEHTRHLQLPADDPRNPVTSSPGLMMGMAGVVAHLVSRERDEDLGAWLL